MRSRSWVSIAVVMAMSGAAAHAAPLGESQQAEIVQSVDGLAPDVERLGSSIWKLAELGYLEAKSSALLQADLRKAGFKVEAGAAGMPTAFVARFRNGDGPVIAILAEFDALPGLSQAAVPQKQRVPEMSNGHGCGHNLFGAASVGAAIATKQWMLKNQIKGELRLYGTPAEEGGSGKVYFVRSGVLKDVDLVLHWHPSDKNAVSRDTSMANISGKFRFHGASAHAAAAPDKGRSALDGVEAMNMMVNLMREHIPDMTRIHYVITSGGEAPNVVPDFAEVYYYVRHTDMKIVREVMERVKSAANGAALGTGTTVDFEATGGVYNMLVNETLADVMARNLNSVGGVQWSPAEWEFAKQMREQLPAGAPPLENAQKVDTTPPEKKSFGSTDVADISWTTPTVGLSTATWIPGTPAHSWQSTAQSGMSIGTKGSINAAKVLALTAAELFQSPEIVSKAKAELAARQGPDFRYEAMVGDRAPPLDYRLPPKGGR